MSDYIPDHILPNVLLRLPFDSLIRFKCVSKSWRDLIDSCYFAGLHSRRSRLAQTYPHPGTKIIALVGSQLYTFDSVVKSGKDTYDAIAKELSRPPVKFLNYELMLVGSCNGILCLWNWCTDDLVLWNPFTRSYSEVPSPPEEFTTKSGRSPLQAAFGYDQTNDDYKVVKWYVCSAPAFHINEELGSHRYELCVYSLRQNSWKRIRDAIPFELPENYLFTQDCTLANGALHWLVTDITVNFENFIVAFDLGSYEFRKVSCGCPSSLNPDYRYNKMMKMSCLNGCLSLVCYTYCYLRASHERSGVDIWVMEEYAAESSWTKLTSIKLHDEYVQISKLVAFSKKRGNLLLVIDGQLVLYNVERKTFRNVAIRGNAPCSASCLSVGSLVSPTSYSIERAGLDSGQSPL